MKKIIHNTFTSRASIFSLFFLISFNLEADVKELVCTAKVSEEILNISWIKPDNMGTGDADPLEMEIFEHCKKC